MRQAAGLFSHRYYLRVKMNVFAEGTLTKLAKPVLAIDI